MQNKKEKKLRVLVIANVAEKTKHGRYKVSTVYEADTAKEAIELFKEEYTPVGEIKTTFLKNAHIDHYLNFEDRL